MTNFLMFGGWLFWTILALYIIISVLIIENDGYPRLGATVLTTLVAVFLLYRTANAGSNTLVNSLPGLGWLIAAYIGLGVIWSLIKWSLYVKFRFNQYLEQITIPPNYVKESPEKEADWLKEMKERYKPVVNYNTERLATWILFWPFSTLRWICADAIFYLVGRLGVVYNAISSSQFKD